MANEDMAKEDENLEFMTKKRLVELKAQNQFKNISISAEEAIKEASDEDILMLKMKFNSPTLTIVSAEVYDEKKFLNLAF